jgi:hypothetical protein
MSRRMPAAAPTLSMKVAAFALALGLFLSASAQAQQVDVSTGSVVKTVAKLRPGEFVWAPEIAPQGPMLLIVNVKTQRAVVYRNGVPIGATTVSTGRPGHSTPTGVFTILEKQVEHHSSKYDSAPMPYMQRLTWYGVALHAGTLPGYPASHGCIRMPKGFAKLLYSVTGLGMTVVIAAVPSAPHVAPTPNIVAEGPGENSAGEAVLWNPEKSPRGPVSVVISAADRRAVVLRNGVIIGSAPVTIQGAVTGTWAYALRNVDAAGQHWVRIELSAKATGTASVPLQEWQRFTAPAAFKAAVAAIVQPGMTIVVTPDSLRSAAAPAAVLQSGS